ncbi:MAG: disulfide bond formation protein B, partial [Pseudomonadota bacterium]
MMTVYGRMLLAAAGSALLLLGALAFQYVGGLAPCPMCLWQRWPHLLAVLVGILGVTVLWRQRRWLALAGAALMTASAGLAIFHAGVEWRWWEGLSTCSAPAPGSDVSADALLEQILEAPVVRC